MSVNKELLDILVCPESREALIYFEAGMEGDQPFLFCPSSRLKYRIDQDIPVMLVEEADRLDAAGAEKLVASARDKGLLS
jgi:uncharacterized protein YbaR (Trm112 family)